MITEIRREAAKLTITTKKLREFCLLFCAVSGIMGGIGLWKGSPYWAWFAGISIGFLLAGLFFPMAFRRPYRLWMSLAFIMSWFMTRLILIFAFFLIMTPMALLLKILRKDILEKGLNKEAGTYWKRYEPVQDKERYKKQF